MTAAIDSGLHAVMVPVEYGGMGLGVTEASVITEEINRSGGAGANIHATMFTMGIVARHGSDEQKAALAASRSRAGYLRLTMRRASPSRTRALDRLEDHDRRPAWTAMSWVVQRPEGASSPASRLPISWL